MTQTKRKCVNISIILLSLLLLFTMFPMSAYAAETSDDGDSSVEIYLSVSHDAGYVKTPKNHIMAFKKMTVPYFDLANYDLQQYYFVSESYGKGEGTVEDESGQIKNPSSDLTPGNSEYAKGKVTMLHALIYATEVYYLGVKPEDAGKGQLAIQGKIGTDVFAPEGSVGSLYLKHFWDMDENLNYYHNYKYPLASEGWGSTADQILLHDGDIITLGHFENWSFHQDPLCVFNFIRAGESESLIAEVEQNQSIDLTVMRAGKGDNYATAYFHRTEKPAVYFTPVDQLTTGTVSGWNYLGNADADGKITVKAWMPPGEYLLCIAGQYGKNLPQSIVSTPGGIILKVTEAEIVLGDANGDGKLSIKDVINLRKHLLDETHEINIKNADLNEDGKISIKDVMLLRKALLK